MFIECTLVFLAWFCITQSEWTNFELIGGENSNKGIIVTSFRWHRINRTAYVANGHYIITEDFSNDYDIEIKTYYSAMGNSQLRLITYGVHRTPLCDFIDGHYYRTIVQPDYEAHSNLPKAIPGLPLCPLYKKDIYTFSNWSMDGHNYLPKYLDPGFYKIFMLYFKRSSNQLNCKRSYNVRVT